MKITISITFIYVLSFCKCLRMTVCEHTLDCVNVVVAVVAEHSESEGHPVCAPTSVHVQVQVLGTLHRVRGSRVRPFPITPPCRLRLQRDCVNQVSVPYN